MKKWILPTVVGTTTLLVGGGITAGIILPNVNSLKEGIGKFVPGSGSSPMSNWNAEKKLNYVALGDSETAGFNGYLSKTAELQGKTDYISYADILAKDLNNSGNLNQYHNFAVSGARLSDLHTMVGENQLIHKTIKDADLITLTIGANDLLSFVKILDMPFKLSLDGILQTLNGSITDTNAIRDRLFGSGGSSAITTQNESPSNINESQKTTDMVKRSIEMLAEMTRTKNYSHIISLHEDYKEIVFDLIRRDIMFLIRDLRKLAPHAQIVVLGHAMPFAQWPSDNVLDVPREDMSGKTIRQIYEKMIVKMREGSTFSLTGENNYTTFLKVDDLLVKKSANGTTETDARDGENKRFVDYIKKDHTDAHYYERNAMPNAADIHPSTFGHQLIGNAVFDYVSKHLKVQDPISDYSYTTPFDGIYDGPLKEGAPGYEAAVLGQIGPLERIDENPELSHTASDMLYGLFNGTGTLSSLLPKILPSVSNINDFDGFLKAALHVVDLLEEKGAARKWLTGLASLFGSLGGSSDTTKIPSYKDLNEYIEDKFGIESERTTSESVINFMQNLKDVGNEILHSLDPNMQQWTTQTDWDTLKSTIETQVDTMISNLKGAPANMIKTQYDNYVNAINTAGKVHIEPKTNPTLDDVFNYAIMSSVIDQQTFFGDLIMLMVGKLNITL